MQKKEFILLTIFIFLIIALVFFFLSLLSSSDKPEVKSVLNPGEEIIIFSGDVCPDCHLVEAYIVENKINERLNISIKEVYSNLNNAHLYEDKFKRCNPEPETKSVPMLWDNSFCLIGPSQIIPYLNSKIK